MQGRDAVELQVPKLVQVVLVPAKRVLAELNVAVERPHCARGDDHRPDLLAGVEPINEVRDVRRLRLVQEFVGVWRPGAAIGHPSLVAHPVVAQKGCLLNGRVAVDRLDLAKPHDVAVAGGDGREVREEVAGLALDEVPHGVGAAELALKAAGHVVFVLGKPAPGPQVRLVVLGDAPLAPDAHLLNVVVWQLKGGLHSLGCSVQLKGQMGAWSCDAPCVTPAPTLVCTLACGIATVSSTPCMFAAACLSKRQMPPSLPIDMAGEVQ
eukprot:CAMPEP_0168388250 /NCGR_PEP_ID=MMETSP0228-20121227/16357_1 /TAXON_ID=133427 /ORGANISM="Protoceratium reticulatum, Strain CCCM 535 (=CCMP 1889)" /LENGTH=265 /DNA_ID=CAMNT_0008401497 /DNA_START=100 /DNA_END=899 /DNA_ORIENTATION=+